MYTVQLLRADSGEPVAYLAAPVRGGTYTWLARCHRASHFLMPATAALFRDELEPEPDHLIAVKPCCCPVGADYPQAHRALGPRVAPTTPRPTP